MKPLSIAVAMLAVAAIPAHAVTVFGVPSCGDWLQHHASTPIEATASNLRENSWLGGYVSGLAAMDPTARENNLGPLANTDMVSMISFVSNHCRANPLDDVADAAHLLYFELTKRAAKK